MLLQIGCPGLQIIYYDTQMHKTQLVVVRSATVQVRLRPRVEQLQKRYERVKKEAQAKPPLRPEAPSALALTFLEDRQLESM